MHMIDMSHNEGSHSLIDKSPLASSQHLVTLPFGSSTVDPMLGDECHNPWRRLEHETFYIKQLQKYCESECSI